MKICTKCVTPETAETNKFGGDGVCSVCIQIDNKAKINWDERKEDLNNLIAKYKNQNSYDCIIPFSGGKILYSLCIILLKIIILDPS